MTPFAWAIDDITHVEGMDDYVKFHRPGVRPVVSNMTMKAALTCFHAIACACIGPSLWTKKR
ncbi:MAG: hypothetical protein IPN85_14635 [Flavobacteriales bacterium]|nr:hypothetical protein [Flavobacteriales bacterium]